MLNDNLYKTEKVLSLLPRAKPEIIRRVVEATKNFRVLVSKSQNIHFNIKITLKKFHKKTQNEVII